MRDFKGKSVIEFPDTYVVIDTETTGLDYEYCDLIEISAIRISHGNETGRFSSLVKPDDFDGLGSFITNLTGITDEMIYSAPSVHDVILQFMDFIGTDTLVGHNVNFDINFLYDAAEQNDRILSNSFVDTMRIARKLYPDMSHHRLQDLVEKFNIPTERSHRALDDVLATNACYQHMKADVLSKGDIDSFIHSFSKKKIDYRDYIAGLVPPEDVDTTNPIYGKVVVFTGALSCMQRKEALSIVSSMGGIPAASVTSKTNYLVIGNEEFATSVKNGETTKMKKALELKEKGKDITTLSENSFFDLLSSELDYHAPAKSSDDEAAALQIIEAAIGTNCTVEQRSANYLTVLAPNGVDFCRIKFGAHSSWFSLDLWHCSDEVKNDPRLSDVKNKNQRHWKISVDNVSSLEEYADLISASYRSTL